MLVPFATSGAFHPYPPWEPCNTHKCKIVERYVPVTGGLPLPTYDPLPWYCDQHKLSVAVMKWLAKWVLAVMVIDQACQLIARWL